MEGQISAYLAILSKIDKSSQKNGVRKSHALDVSVEGKRKTFVGTDEENELEDNSQIRQNEDSFYSARRPVNFQFVSPTKNMFRTDRIKDERVSCLETFGKIDSDNKTERKTKMHKKRRSQGE